MKNNGGKYEKKNMHIFNILSINRRYKALLHRSLNKPAYTF